MAFLKFRKSWEIPERLATSEAAFLNRRQAIQTLGIAAAGLVACERSGAGGNEEIPGAVPRSATSGLYPAPRSPRFVLDRPITDERVAARINNFYEFTESKNVYRYVEKFETRPWQVKVTGHVERPLTLDIDDLARKVPLEERLYRHRCVEAWSMAVPWTGFPMKAFVELAKPTSQAKFVRLVSFDDPEQAPGQRARDAYPWPYYEGLTLAEATNELTLLVTGIYGHELPKQHGAPIRLVVPWKYGFKSIKSIVLVEFRSEQPPTFWNTAVPHEYDFAANVDPAKPHPRWSQATERIIDTGKRVPTLPFNGYGEWVAGLYKS